MPVPAKDNGNADSTDTALGAVVSLLHLYRPHRKSHLMGRATTPSSSEKTPLVVPGKQ
jgi:hypothetical protein